MRNSELYELVYDLIKAKSSKIIERNNRIEFNCMYHNDKNPSASLSKGADGRPLLYCRVCGSIFFNVLEELDLKQSKSQSNEWNQLEKWIWVQKRNGALVEYDLFDIATRRYALTVWRGKKSNGQKAFRIGKKLENNHATLLPEDFDSTRAIYVPSGIDELAKAIKEGQVIATAEGQKDVDTISKVLGIPSFCAMRHGIHENILPYLKGARVLIFSDNDMAGQKYAEANKKALDSVCEATAIVRFNGLGLGKKADVTDFLERRSAFELVELVQPYIEELMKQ